MIRIALSATAFAAYVTLMFSLAFVPAMYSDYQAAHPTVEKVAAIN
jgi:hypothetical protein